MTTTAPPPAPTRAAPGAPSRFWDLGVPDYEPRQDRPGASADVAIVGAGFSGLACGIALARRGFSVAVFEQGAIAHGASGRSGGMVGPSFHKLGMAGLTAKYGAQKAQGIMQAGMEALDHFEAFVAREELECDFQLTGRFRGARSPEDFDAMAAECARLNAQVGLPYRMVSRAEMPTFIGSTTYCGGVFYPRDGGVHPKRLVNALAGRSEALGVRLAPGTPVHAIAREAGGFRLHTAQGDVTARHVVVATNGYADARTPDMNARVVPITVTVAATRDLGADRIRAMSPRLAMHGETGRVFTWSRPTPDGRRFIFGGRICSESVAPADRPARVAASVARIFPELTAQDFEHVWHGRIAYTADHAPHLAAIDGIWHIGGYCGSGVTRSIYFAEKVAGKIAGEAGSTTAFDDLPFPKVPFRPLAPLAARVMTRYYKWLDTRDLRHRRPGV
ncbi:FAD-binding oxidoreductase [Paroceanicella profunda]|uniref:FAD-binding oxidoreductase n=1 Tax=Paroceanicella profunda TaxID=2579971 RepID=A0A5B8G3H9_9RHOB|nr:FAD-dependent oxidoreductase [Paroceanicella profunda]QDL93333.1 FAD-binding oxidoreductase [Paroceanicella profunda]